MVMLYKYSISAFITEKTILKFDQTFRLAFSLVSMDPQIFFNAIYGVEGGLTVNGAKNALWCLKLVNTTSTSFTSQIQYYN